MKFRATLSDRGLGVLEKGLLPTLEKFSRSCILLLGPEMVHLIQRSLDTDGLQVAAVCQPEALFDEGTVKVESRHNNLVAFELDVTLMLRVLKAARANDAEQVDLKLTMRSVPTQGSAQPQQQPFLSFNCRGHNLNMTQDLPISKPYSPAEMDRLLREKEGGHLCPYYLDLQPEIARLQAIVDKLKSIGGSMALAMSKGGDAHLQVAAPGVHLATELRGLRVAPAATADAATPLRGTSAEARLQEALGNGDAVQVTVQLKHMSKSLHASQLTQPAQLLCGIGDNRGYLHYLFVYRDPFNSEGYDDSLNLSFKLPVLEDS